MTAKELRDALPFLTEDDDAKVMIATSKDNYGEGYQVSNILHDTKNKIIILVAHIPKVVALRMEATPTGIDEASAVKLDELCLCKK